MLTISLGDRRALVTGGTRGIGQASIRVNTIVPGFVETSGARARIERMASEGGLDSGAARGAVDRDDLRSAPQAGGQDGGQPDGPGADHGDGVTGRTCPASTPTS